MYLLKRGNNYYFNQRAKGKVIRLSLKTSCQKTAQLRALSLSSLVDSLQRLQMTYDEILTAAALRAKEMHEEWWYWFRRKDYVEEIRDVVVERYEDNFVHSRNAINRFDDEKLIQGIADGIFLFKSKNTLAAMGGDEILLEEAQKLLKDQEGASLELARKTLESPLSEYLDSYFKDKRAKGSASEASIVEYKAGITDFIEICGDNQPSDYSSEDARRFRDTLLRLPKNRKKKKEYKDLSVTELLECDIPEGECIGASTVSDRIQYVRTFFEWLNGEAIVTVNPFKNVSIVKTSKSYSKFDSDDLKAIFSSPIYDSAEHPFWNEPKRQHVRNASNWWALLILLYTGARAGEVAQLRVRDVVEDDSTGIWYFNLKDEEDEKRLKTKNARRRVPIHKVLIELGLLDYVALIKSELHEELLPKLKAIKRDLPSTRITEWFRTQYRDKVPSLQYLKDQKKTTHSFRHTFAEASYSVGNRVEYTQQIIGHSNKDEGVTSVYKGDGYSLEILKECIDKITFDSIDLDRLYLNSWREML